MRSLGEYWRFQQVDLLVEGRTEKVFCCAVEVWEICVNPPPAALLFITRIAALCFDEVLSIERIWFKVESMITLANLNQLIEKSFVKKEIKETVFVAFQFFDDLLLEKL